MMRALLTFRRRLGIVRAGAAVAGRRPVMRSEKTLIMLILLVLVGLFIVGTGVMSSLDLRYSQSAMSALRLRQIKDTFYANLDRIDARFKLMEKNAAALARLGAAVGKDVRPEAGAEIRAAVGKEARDFPEALGGGIWFDRPMDGRPADGRSDAEAPSSYAYWQNKSSVAVKDVGADKTYDYTHQEWYLAALPAGWDRGKPRPEDFYWTPVYNHALSPAAVVSVVTYIRNGAGQIVGLATSEDGGKRA